MCIRSRARTGISLGTLDLAQTYEFICFRKTCSSNRHHAENRLETCSDISHEGDLRHFIRTVKVKAVSVQTWRCMGERSYSSTFVTLAQSGDEWWVLRPRTSSWEKNRLPPPGTNFISWLGPTPRLKIFKQRKIACTLQGRWQCILTTRCGQNYNAISSLLREKRDPLTIPSDNHSVLKLRNSLPFVVLKQVLNETREQSGESKFGIHKRKPSDWCVMSAKSLEKRVRHITRRKGNFTAATEASIRSLQNPLVEEQHLEIIRQHARGSSVYCILPLLKHARSIMFNSYPTCYIARPYIKLNFVS